VSGSTFYLSFFDIWNGGPWYLYAADVVICISHVTSRLSIVDESIMGIRDNFGKNGAANVSSPILKLGYERKCCTAAENRNKRDTWLFPLVIDF
jgi:hypothetical protein